MTKETIIMSVKELEQRQKIARIYQRWQRRSCYGEPPTLPRNKMSPEKTPK